LRVKSLQWLRGKFLRLLLKFRTRDAVVSEPPSISADKRDA
jgi:hypothetical protein